MKPFYNTINERAGRQAQMLLKHLRAAGIAEWGDLTRAKLYDLRDELGRTLAPNSARLYGAALSAFLKRYRDEVALPDGWEDILRFRGNKSVHAHLTKGELKLFEAVMTATDKERIVKYQSLIEAYTGARVSDIVCLTDANIKDGWLTYTSKKTKTTASVPVSDKVRNWIRFTGEHAALSPSLAARDQIIKRLCKRAGINERVKVVRGGRTREVEKWEAISSHDLRRSFVTNLVQAGASLADTGKMAGHGSNLAMTQRYICDYRLESLPEKALAYLND